MFAIPLLIIDGIIATGKTSLITQLQTEPRYLQHPTRLIISEHLTERVLEGRRPSTGDRLAVLRTILQSITGLHGILGESKFAGLPNYAPHVILERFHLTHAANDIDLGPYLELEGTMTELSACMVFLYHRQEMLEARIDETRVQRGKHWCAYLDSFGGRQGALDHFRRIQERSWELYSRSTLPKLAIEGRSEPLDLLSRQIISHWLGDEAGRAEPSCQLVDQAND